MREIWVLQPQFDNRRGARPFRLLSQERFRAAYDFLVLRAQLGEVDQELVDWWTAFQHADDLSRQQMAAGQQQAHQQGSSQPDGEAPKKKRRRKPRRKKPAAPTAE